MRPPALPAPKPFSPLFGGLYAAAYGVGGQPLVHQAVKRLGPVVALPVLGFGPVVAVADAALAKEVFTAKPDVLLGGEGVGPAAAIYGAESMFVQDEPEHLRRRRLLARRCTEQPSTTTYPSSKRRLVPRWRPGPSARRCGCSMPHASSRST